MNTGEKLKQARVSAGLSQQKMAEKLGINRTTYQYWETSGPNLEGLKLVCKALNLPMSYFIDKYSGETGGIIDESSKADTDFLVEKKIIVKEENKKTDYLDKYISTLEQNNQFLQRMLETSLGSIVETQMAQLSHQKALAWYQAYNVAEGDQNKLVEELTRLNSKVAEFAGFRTEKDSVKRS